MNFLLLYIVYPVLGLAALAYGLICFVVIRSINQLAQGIEIIPVNLREAYPALFHGVEESSLWAEAQGFRYVGSYRTTISDIENVFAVWRHESRPTYLVRYHAAEQVFFDFVTLFQGQYGLTTSSTKDSQLSPRPCGEYQQSFDAALDVLLTMHADAEHFLIQEGRLKEQWVERPIVDLINESVMRQAHYVQQLPFWQFRGAWWYFVRRRVMHNKGVQELHARGLAPLPHEPGFTAFND